MEGGPKDLTDNDFNVDRETFYYDKVSNVVQSRLNDVPTTQDGKVKFWDKLRYDLVQWLIKFESKGFDIIEPRVKTEQEKNADNLLSNLEERIGDLKRLRAAVEAIKQAEKAGGKKPQVSPDDSLKLTRDLLDKTPSAEENEPLGIAEKQTTPGVASPAETPLDKGGAAPQKLAHLEPYKIVKPISPKQKSAQGSPIEESPKVNLPDDLPKIPKKSDIPLVEPLKPAAQVEPKKQPKIKDTLAPQKIDYPAQNKQAQAVQGSPKKKIVLEEIPKKPSSSDPEPVKPAAQVESKVPPKIEVIPVPKPDVIPVPKPDNDLPKPVPDIPVPKPAPDIPVKPKAPQDSPIPDSSKVIPDVPHVPKKPPVPDMPVINLPKINVKAMYDKDDMPSWSNLFGYKIFNKKVELFKSAAREPEMAMMQRVIDYAFSNQNNWSVEKKVEFVDKMLYGMEQVLRKENSKRLLHVTREIQKQMTEFKQTLPSSARTQKITPSARTSELQKELFEILEGIYKPNGVVNKDTLRTGEYDQFKKLKHVMERKYTLRR